MVIPQEELYRNRGDFFAFAAARGNISAIAAVTGDELYMVNQRWRLIPGLPFPREAGPPEQRNDAIAMPMHSTAIT